MVAVVSISLNFPFLCVSGCFNKDLLVKREMVVSVI